METKTPTKRILADFPGESKFQAGCLYWGTFLLDDYQFMDDELVEIGQVGSGADQSQR